MNIFSYIFKFENGKIKIFLRCELLKDYDVLLTVVENDVLNYNDIAQIIDYANLNPANDITFYQRILREENHYANNDI